ncbi:hypothetical protein GQR58_003887 [Nymphon striatum]|nr:hypothetical protein GQR58_003887 [Nymphon striatum]
MEELIDAHYAIPVVGVVIFALLVFAFGFKSSVQPPNFNYLLDQKQTGGKSNRKKNKEKKSIPNGHIAEPKSKETSNANQQKSSETLNNQADKVQAKPSTIKQTNSSLQKVLIISKTLGLLNIKSEFIDNSDVEYEPMESDNETIDSYESDDVLSEHEDDSVMLSDSWKRIADIFSDCRPNSLPELVRNFSGINPALNCNANNSILEIFKKFITNDVINYLVKNDSKINHGGWTEQISKKEKKSRKVKEENSSEKQQKKIVKTEAGISTAAEETTDKTTEKVLPILARKTVLNFKNSHLSRDVTQGTNRVGMANSEARLPVTLFPRLKINITSEDELSSIIKLNIFFQIQKSEKTVEKKSNKADTSTAISNHEMEAKPAVQVNKEAVAAQVKKSSVDEIIPVGKNKKKKKKEREDTENKENKKNVEIVLPSVKKDVEKVVVDNKLDDSHKDGKIKSSAVDRTEEKVSKDDAKSNVAFDELGGKCLIKFCRTFMFILDIHVTIIAS